MSEGLYIISPRDDVERRHEKKTVLLMRDYYHLDVYKSSYKLLVEIHKNFTNLNREHKYTIGEKVKEKVFAVLVGIYKANKSDNKVAILEEILDDVEYIGLSLRLLRDLNVLNEKRYVMLLVLSEDVRVQFEKWYCFEVKKDRIPKENK